MQVTDRALLNKLYDCVAGSACLSLGWIVITAASCALDASPKTLGPTANTKVESWQPRAVEPQGTDRARSGVDAERDAGIASMSAPPTRSRSTRDAEIEDADRGDAGSSTDAAPRDAGAPSRAWDAQAPNSPMQPSASPQDASAASDGAAMPPGDASSAGASETVDCQPGDYTGEFSGTLQAAGISVSEVTGPIRASLMLDDTGVYLDMRDVLIVGRDARGNTVRARVSGKINCTTLELEDGQLERGRYYMASRRNTLSFDGVAQGTYTTGPHALHGTWSVSARSASILTGEGAFELVRSAP